MANFRFLPPKSRLILMFRHIFWAPPLINSEGFAALILDINRPMYRLKKENKTFRPRLQKRTFRPHKGSAPWFRCFRVLQAGKA